VERGFNFALSLKERSKEMAVSTNSHFNNAVNGLVSVGADFDKFQMNAKARWAVGTHFHRSDGAIFVYSHFGADVNRGVLVSQDLSESSLTESADVVIAPSVTYKVASEPGNIYPGSIGSHYIVATLASVTVDLYAGGYFAITEGTGIGYTYRIKGNTATNDPATGKVRFELYEPIQVALDATTDFIICGSIYANLEIATAATDVALAGVTCSTMDVSAAAYGFVQKRGIVGILADATTMAAGTMVTLSDDTSGAVQLAGGAGAGYEDMIAEGPILGITVSVAGTGDENVVYLT